jgi:hypothetical protein
MSRHVFDYENTRTVVGWDPPLQTFFIQHGPIDQNKNWFGDEGPALWLGTKPREISNIGQVAYLNDEYTLGIGDSRVMKKLEDDQKYNV